MRFTTPDFGGPAAAYEGKIESEGPGIRQAAFADALLVASPAMRRLLLSAPIAARDYTVDVKIHMLMAGEYPCIPGWHCDAVPRVDGRVKYRLIEERARPNMLLWVSGHPHTVFLEAPFTAEPPADHGALGRLCAPRSVVAVEAGRWCWFSWDTPHRGARAEAAGWRIFVRLIESTALPPLPRQEIVRVHSQVYLNAADFSW